MEVSDQLHFLAALPSVKQPATHVLSIYELEKESKVQWAGL